MTERCTECGLFAGSEYKTDYYKLNDSVFCSIPCFNENVKSGKNNKPKVQPKVINGKQKTNGRVRKAKKTIKRSVASKRRK